MISQRVQKRLTLIFLGCVATFFLFSLASAIHFAKTLARQSLATYAIKTLAAHLEIYRTEHQVYPASLPELISASDADSQKFILQALKPINESGLTLTYRPGTNGFELSVNGIDPWGLKQRKLVMTHKVGQPLGESEIRNQ